MSEKIDGFEIANIGHIPAIPIRVSIFDDGEVMLESDGNHMSMTTKDLDTVASRCGLTKHAPDPPSALINNALAAILEGEQEIEERTLNHRVDKNIAIQALWDVKDALENSSGG